MKNLFSERYGYEKPSDVIIREKLTPEIVNCICTCYDELHETLGYEENSDFIEMEEFLWIYYLHNRKNDFYRKYGSSGFLSTTYINNNEINWFKKLDYIEASLYFLNQISNIKSYAERFSENLNYFFEDLNFGYRIVDNLIVPVTSDEEIKSIEHAIDNSENNVRLHLHTALEKLAERPRGDYRNSIKESISAVEAFCRNKTGKDSLGSALAEMEKHGLHLPSSLKSAFNILYGYTNSQETGIRHPLMDDEGEYVPTADEAVFMLIVCSAFINYLTKKIA